jgi:hypothetical protein
VVIVAASDEETARKYVKDKIGMEGEVTWLMAYYQKIYDRQGNPKEIQAEILYSNGVWYNPKIN